jgi:putative aminopeptidase FrvX
VLRLLEELTRLPGPSGYERAVAERMRAGMREVGVEAEMDRMGNVVGYVPGRSHARKIMLSAHTDEVGLMVKYIRDDGFICFDQNGMMSAISLPGTKVQLVTRNQLYTGVIGTRTAHLMIDEEITRFPALQDLWIDIGATSREEVLAKGIRPGTPIVFHPNFEAECGIVMSKAVDDRVGCTILLKTLDALADTNLEVDLYVTAVVQEEVGSRGARVVARRLAPDWALIVDVVAASDPSTTPQQVTAQLGEGPVIRSMEALPSLIGTLYSERVNERLASAAEAEELLYQFDIFKTWSDAASINLEGPQGISTGGLFIPRRYGHSAAEVISVSDVETTQALVLAFLKSLSPEDLAGPNWLD